MDSSPQLPHAVPFAKEDVVMDHEAAWRESNASNWVKWPAINLKAIYALGIIDDYCEAANVLLVSPRAWPALYMPAFGLIASGLEILGRAINEETRDSAMGASLRKGFRYLREVSPHPDLGPDEIIRTNHHTYTISELIDLRNFADHGQARFDIEPDHDIELLDSFPILIAAALEVYWNELQKDVALCEALGRANIVPFSKRPDAIEKMPRFFQRGMIVTVVFERFNFHIAHRYQ